MRCHTAFGSHLKEEVFITHLKNDFLNNRVLKRMFFGFLCEETVRETD